MSGATSSLELDVVDGRLLPSVSELVAFPVPESQRNEALAGHWQAVLGSAAAEPQGSFNLTQERPGEVTLTRRAADGSSSSSFRAPFR